MALTESQRNQIASYKNQIEGYRKDLQILKDQKKRESDRYSKDIKSKGDRTVKEVMSQFKIITINSYVRQIERKKKQIEDIKGNIKSNKGH